MNRIILLFALLIPFFSQAQHMEVGLLFGGSAYQGDLSPSTSKWSFSQTQPSFGVFGRYNLNKFLTGRINFAYGKIKGNDAQADDPGRQARNLEFQSRILELSAIGEFNVLGFSPESRRFSPYVFAGVGFFNFNPEATYNGRLIALQPLGTEGQGMEGRPTKYSLNQVSIPMGGGVKFAINEKFNIGLELGIRKTFTDYLDDVSTTYVNYQDLNRANGELAAALGNRTGELQNSDPVQVATGTTRGNPDQKDWYLISGVTLSYSFHNNRNGLSSSKRKSQEMGCPKF